MWNAFTHFLTFLFLIITTIPGGSEMLEQVVEQVGHGHPVHSVPEEVDPFCAEQGSTPCSGSTCECHMGASMVLMVLPAASSTHGHWSSIFLNNEHLKTSTGQRNPAPDSRPHSLANAPPVPPPNATV